jgi:2-phosphoglycerate kinase
MTNFTVDPPNWTFLLIGGSSSVGKSRAAARLGHRHGLPWLQVDDLRLAFQRSRVTLPQGNDALYYFVKGGHQNQVWKERPDQLRDALIAVGEALAPAIEAVLLHHVSQREPIIIEGDGILPSLLTRPAVQQVGDAVRAVFIVEPNERVLLRNMLARGRGINRMTGTTLCAEAHVKCLFGQRLAEEAERLGVPVMPARPWESLADRIEAAVSSRPSG